MSLQHRQLLRLVLVRESARVTEFTGASLSEIVAFALSTATAISTVGVGRSCVTTVGEFALVTKFAVAIVGPVVAFALTTTHGSAEATALSTATAGTWSSVVGESALVTELAVSVFLDPC